MNEVPHAPMLSVIIPTHKRPQYLSRAIVSALLAAPDGDVEVLVIPNGNDTSWQTVASEFANDPRVCWHPISTAHACAARNHGLRNTRGHFLRFLDDDDLLDPDGAKLQLKMAVTLDVELVSGSVKAVDANMCPFQTYKHPINTDLFSSMVSPSRLCLPVSHLFKREAVIAFTWDESLPYEQDTEWMLKLAASKVWQWKVIEEVVGYWSCHDADRTSKRGSREDHAILTTNLILRNATQMQNSGSLQDSHCGALLDAVFEFGRGNFPTSPCTWAKYMRSAQRIAPNKRPTTRFYNLPVLRHLDPVMTEWMLLPARIGSRFLRATFQSEN